MVFEIIGKVVLYIIGTLLCGGLMEFLDPTDNDFGIFLGAWLVSVMVFFVVDDPNPMRKDGDWNV